MLCLAICKRRTEKAEEELRKFLNEYIEHPLSQDAIYELARLRVGDRNASIDRAVRTVSGIRVR